jgi:hypothetical protein
MQRELTSPSASAPALSMSPSKSQATLTRSKFGSDSTMHHCRTLYGLPGHKQQNHQTPRLLHSSLLRAPCGYLVENLSVKKLESTSKAGH